MRKNFRATSRIRTAGPVQCPEGEPAGIEPAKPRRPEHPVAQGLQNGTAAREGRVREIDPATRITEIGIAAGPGRRGRGHASAVRLSDGG
jgi:hypothetical protein